MLEGEFILDGYAFGTAAHDVVILEDGFDTGAISPRAQDAESRDSILFGRDHHTPPTWAFTLGISHDDDADAIMADLARVWRNPVVRLTPGVTSTLRFNRNGRAYRVYGRPRRFAMVPDAVADPHWQMVDADFRVEGTQMYADELQEVTLNLGEQIEDSGVILPETKPWLLGGTTASGTAIANVQTLDPAPFVATITANAGPLAQFTLEGEGWALDFGMTLEAGQALTVDTRAMTALVSGSSVAGALSRRSSLAARLWAGSSTLAFTGIDATASATATVSWHSTYPIF